VRRALVFAALVASAGCSGDDDGPPPGSDLPDTWTLDAEGIEVEVTRQPYGVAVRDAEGDEVLRSLGDARGEGYAPVAWTTGETTWRSGGITKGHYGFSARLDPWRERFVVVDAEERAAEGRPRRGCRW